MSRQLTSMKPCYAVYDMGCLAEIRAPEKFCRYVPVKIFQVFKDHHSLNWLICLMDLEPA